MSVNISQILLVVLLFLLLFGRGKISSLMGDVAEGIKNFRRGLQDDSATTASPRELSENEHPKKQTLGQRPQHRLG